MCSRQWEYVEARVSVSRAENMYDLYGQNLTISEAQAEESDV